MSTIEQNIAAVRRYHETTKHRFEAYAKGPEALDWSMQPDPFRRFESALKIKLPLGANQVPHRYSDIYDTAAINAEPCNIQNLGILFELSMALSAWKEYAGDRWALRCNPSSGNLHPTEAYLITTSNIESDDQRLAAGVYHYLSLDHSLEQRCLYAAKEADSQSQTPSKLYIGLSSIFWREAWKYGERAYRYCQLDIGHAIAAIRYACASLGWSAKLASGIDDAQIATILGLDRSADFADVEAEHPDLILQIDFTAIDAVDSKDLARLIQASQQGEWFGQANILDRRHLYQWPIIEDVALAAAGNPLPEPNTSITSQPMDIPTLQALSCDLLASDIIRRRRSAQAFDGQTEMSAQQFYRLLDTLLVREHTPPWDSMPWQPRIHPVFFVHRVNGIKPGLYILLRNSSVKENLTAQLSDKMQWTKVEDAPEHLQLFCLINANAKKAAATLSCHQAIASDGTFSVAMLSEFDAALEQGPWNYKQLYWEAGILGQVLYLEAEAIDLRGTGIGCFFDDPVHEILGVKNTHFQSVYHFTVGGAVVDSRLRTVMPYQR